MNDYSYNHVYMAFVFKVAFLQYDHVEGHPMKYARIIIMTWIIIYVYSSGYMGRCPTPGPRLNIKTVLSTYGDFHVKDKTAVRTSYL